MVVVADYTYPIHKCSQFSRFVKKSLKYREICLFVLFAVVFLFLPPTELTRKNKNRWIDILKGQEKSNKIIYANGQKISAKKKAVRWMFVVSSLVKTAGVANIYIPTPWFLLLLSTTKQVEELAINNLKVYCLCAVLCVQVAIISWLFTV
jgi:hypothetical protein